MASPGKKHVLIRIDPALHEALQRWSDDEMRSFNMHVEYLLTQALRKAGRKVSKSKKKGADQETP